MYYYDLIYDWCVSRGKYGLTIPYILGCQRVLGLSLFSNTFELLSDINNTTFDKKIAIRHCYNLNEYILCIESVQYLETAFDWYNNLGTEVDEFSTKTFEEVAKTLATLYDEIHLSNKFSKKRLIDGSYEWEGFSTEEVDYIKKVCGS